jgi:hypothetical protein
MEAGVRVELVGPEGKKAFKIELEEVTLTDSTRVFKASLFPKVPSLGALKASVSDDQLDSSTVGREIAVYFLGTFLGCKISETAQIATKRYTEAAEQFLNEVTDDEKKMRYEVALLADLQSQSKVVNPEVFAREYLDMEDRDAFVARFKEDDGTVRLIQKDTTLINRRISRAWVELDNGVRLTGPPEAVEGVVTALNSAVDENGERIDPPKIRRVR